MEERQLKRSLRTTSISERRVGTMALKDTAIIEGRRAEPGEPKGDESG
jgi:hypothetical protein